MEHFPSSSIYSKKDFSEKLLPYFESQHVEFANETAAVLSSSSYRFSVSFFLACCLIFRATTFSKYWQFYCVPPHLFASEMASVIYEPILDVGDEIPSFDLESHVGKIVFRDIVFGRWCLLLTFHQAFEPVATTDLGMLGRLKEEFEERDILILAIGNDSGSTLHANTLVEHFN